MRPPINSNVTEQMKTEEADFKKAKQLQYRQMLDEQRSNRTKKTEEGIVPTNLKDRPF